MRPIDADALGVGKAKPEVFDEPKYAEGWNSAIEIINNALTLTLDDIVPHGRWIMHEGYDECNLCHTKSIYGSNYCPNCGAKMDLEVDDETD